MHRVSGWRDWIVWPFCAVLLVLAPLLFSGSFALALLSQMGIAIVACLSFNLLFGQGGMLSFGHAVYAGLGGFVAMHALNMFSAGAGWLPVSLVPLCGGLGGLAFALVFAYPSTRRAGSSFAMITLGLGELVYALTTLLPGFFGGEAGIAGNRVNGRVVGGLSFGPAIELYYLLALYTLVCALLMYLFTRTPLGQMLQAVRDNPQRVASIGYDPQRVRYLAMSLAGFFAGVSGGMAALHFEIVNAEAVGSARSAAYLVFTVLGGTASFAGPVLGGVLMVLCTVLLSAWTKAWLLYLGLGFVLVVVYAPGGLAGVLAQQLRLARSGRLLPLLPWYGELAVCGLVALWGVALAIEMLYHQQLHAASGSALTVLGLALDTATPGSWFTALGLLLAGGLPCVWVYPRCAARYAQAHAAAGLGAQPGLARGSGDAAPGAGLAGAAQALRGYRGRLRRGLVRASGDRVALIGPNGAGKSTLFNLISGHAQPSAGAVQLHGRSITGLPPFQIARLGLARSFQISNVFPQLSVYENLRCSVLWSLGYGYTFARLLGSMHDATARTDALMERVGLTAQARTLAAHLPYAQQRALELGITLGSGADVVLLDEPTAGMNRSEAAYFTDLIRSATAGKTLLLVEHDMDVVADLADKIAVLVQGRIIAFGPPQAVRADPAVQAAYLGTAV